MKYTINANKADGTYVPLFKFENENAAIEKLNEIMSEPMAWNFVCLNIWEGKSVKFAKTIWKNPNYLRQTREFRMVVEGEQ